MLLLSVSFLVGGSGCSLVILANKVFFGDPLVPCLFKQQTGLDLLEEQKTVLLVCSTPEFLKSEHSALDQDLSDGIYRRFKRQELNCIPPYQVDSWLSRMGGVWSDPDEIAQEFEADYIIHIDIDNLSYYEENTPNFFHGQAHGFVTAYEVKEIDGQKQAFTILQHEYETKYPAHYPISTDNMSERTFAEKFTSRMSDQLARMFYDYHASEEIN